MRAGAAGPAAALSELDAYGEGVSKRLRATATACEDTVEDLDESARSGAKGAMETVDMVEQDCNIVLLPEIYGATEPEVEAARKNVRDACR